MFYLFAAMIVTFSILTVTSRRILRSAVFLLFVLVSTAGLYFWLNYFFLAAIQLSLYAGGIVVLIVFSILLTSQINDQFPKVKPVKSILSLVAAVAGAVVSIGAILQFNFPKQTQMIADSSLRAIGKAMLSYGKGGYVLPFEVITILLLAAMFGAIVIAKKKND
jgi:NADH-quinone oxidoreductase subunit J